MSAMEDSDPIETREWIDSLSSVVHHAGRPIDAQQTKEHFLGEVGDVSRVSQARG